MKLFSWFRRDPDLSRVQIVAALFKLPVIRPEKPGYKNLRIVRSKVAGLVVRSANEEERRRVG